MKRLVLRSVNWSSIAKDIEDFFDECQHCQHAQRRNKEPEKLPEEETTRPYQCITMDGFKTEYGEHGLVLVDKHTGFIWCRKVGNLETGTAEKIQRVLEETMGPRGVPL